mgnify:CR=1 FL=1
MAGILHLENFYIQSMHLDFHPGDVPEAGDVATADRVSFDYDVLYNSELPDTWAMMLNVYLAPPEDEQLAGYELEVQIFGVFDASEINPTDIEYIIRLNGLMVLYGLLRGQVAGHSGAFPLGKLMLPSVNMVEVVEEVEAEKAAELELAAQEAAKAKPKKKASAKKKAPAKKKPASPKKRPSTGKKLN